MADLSQTSIFEEAPDRVISLSKRGLELISREEYPKIWAGFHDALGNAYSSVFGSDIAEIVNNRKLAISHFEQSFKICTREKFPEQWAQTHLNMANPYISLGYLKREKHSQYMDKAFQHLNFALEVFSHHDYPDKWAGTQNNLGIYFWNRKDGNRADNLEAAIEHFRLALLIITKERYPSRWGELQYNLASVSRERVNGNHSENLELAIKHYELALEVYIRNEYPNKWAVAQNGLGLVYAYRIKGSPSKNIEIAIKKFRLALEVHTRELFSDHWANIQTNLGNAYGNRVQGDHANNLEMAIQCFKLAEEIQTRDALPGPWARIQNNLGNAYRERVRGAHSKNIEMAIAYYKHALEIHTRKNFPDEWASLQTNMGNAYAQKVSGNRDENIEVAIRHFQSALEIYSQENYPDRWAITHGNLGNAYVMRISGIKAENVDKAISHHEMALRVHTRETYRKEWAKIQLDLGIAYSSRVNGNKAKNIELSIDHYQQALQVFTKESYPIECRGANFNLGILLQSVGRWNSSAMVLKDALSADELLYQSALTQTSQIDSRSKSQNIIQNLAYSLAKAGTEYWKSAVEVLEDGRARLLSEALQLDVGRLTRLREQNKETYDRLVKLNEELVELRMRFSLETGQQSAQLKQIEVILSKHLPGIHDEIRKISGFEDFLLPLDITEISKAASNAPLIYFCVTYIGSIGLVVYENGKIDLIRFGELTSNNLQRYMRGDDENDQNVGYFEAYQSWRNESNTKEGLINWENTIEKTTGWLWGVLMGNLMKYCSDEKIHDLVIIATSWLNILPLHAAWREDLDRPSQKFYALDLPLRIRYSPNARALLTVQSISQENSDSLLLVEDPDGSLFFSQGECQTVAKYFDPNKTRYFQEGGAFKTEVSAAMELSKVLHFSTHGSVNFDHPLTSCLVLNDETGKEDFLLLEEIMALNMEGVEIAILSACETGLPGIQAIDEAISLPAGFMQAGVSSVIGTQWSVLDHTTMMLMAKFYEYWKGCGDLAVEALRKAQIWLRDSTNREKRNLLKKLISDEDLEEIKMRADADTALLGLIEFLQGGSDDDISFSSLLYWAPFTFNGVG